MLLTLWYVHPKGGKETASLLPPRPRHHMYNVADLHNAQGPIFIWSSVEPSIGILGACMPAFPPLIRLVKTRATQGYGSSESYSSNPVNTCVWSARRKQSRMNEDELQLTNIERGSDTNFNGKGIMVQSEINQCTSIIDRDNQG